MELTNEQKEFVNNFVYGICKYDETTQCWNVTGAVHIENSDVNIPLQFGIVTNDFIIEDSNIETLKGVPECVGGSFGIECCKFNKGLDFVPEYVGNCFHINGNTYLENEFKVPEFVGGQFFFGDNYQLLQQVPDYVGSDMVVCCPNGETEKVKRPKKLIGVFRNYDPNGGLYV